VSGPPWPGPANTAGSVIRRLCPPYQVDVACPGQVADYFRFCGGFWAGCVARLRRASRSGRGTDGDGFGVCSAELSRLRPPAPARASPIPMSVFGRKADLVRVPRYVGRAKTHPASLNRNATVAWLRRPLCHPESLVHFSLHGRSSEVTVGLLLPRDSAPQRHSAYCPFHRGARAGTAQARRLGMRACAADASGAERTGLRRCGRRAAVAGRRGPISPTTAIAVYVKCTIVDNHGDK
jgi:hypothetical protein